MISADCIIYCNPQWGKEHLIEQLIKETGCKRTSSSFLTQEKYEISVIKNQDSKPEKKIEFADQFLYYKFKIDISFPDRIEINQAVLIVGALLNWLWNQNIPAVAAADYEDLLPNNGINLL